ncbi:MAG TPA: MFS transporter [Kineosporiaceae bacterium]|nr:MFS transporter [Kineosporiaceae bacterium]
MDAETSPRRWAVLAIGMTALIAACAFQYGLPFLMPAFRADGLSRVQAGLLVSAPIFGVLCALVIWGVITDWLGERWVLTAGLAGAAAALLAAATADRLITIGVLLFVAGACAACVHVASGRLILGWFPVQERGLAMGLRQTGQPLGVGVAALALPSLGDRSIASALGFLAGCCLLAALLIVLGVRDAHREPAPAVKAASPYRGDYLWRIHLASSLMVIPQFTVAAFGFDYLVSSRGWSIAAAGPLLAGAQIGGAGIRLTAGWWSDRAGNRLGPMRSLCLATCAVLLLLAVGASSGSALAVLAVLIAAILTVSTNGLAFTAVAERAGQAWAGRALGVQNTAQNVCAAATPPVMAAVITGVGPLAGYPAAFSVVVGLPLLAALVLPVAGENVWKR